MASRRTAVLARVGSGLVTVGFCAVRVIRSSSRTESWVKVGKTIRVAVGEAWTWVATGAAVSAVKAVGVVAESPPEHEIKVIARTIKTKAMPFVEWFNLRIYPPRNKIIYFLFSAHHMDSFTPSLEREIFAAVAPASPQLENSLAT